jgi:hypothetical protein
VEWETRLVVRIGFGVEVVAMGRIVVEYSVEVLQADSRLHC